MNDLSMAPLPAKMKHETDRAGRKIVFRCGVRDCPESFAVIRPEIWPECIRLYRTYILGKSGIYRRSRRSAQRFKSDREHQGKERKFWNAEKEKLKAKIAAGGATEFEQEGPESIDRMMQFEEEGKRILQGLYDPPAQGFPIVVKCARCGRLSKIEEAAKTA